LAGKHFIKNIINAAADTVSFFIPRSKKRVICGGWSGDRFCDNSKAMFLYLNENKESLGIERVTWQTRNGDLYRQLKRDGFDVQMVNSLPAVLASARSKYHIVDVCGGDIQRIFSGGAVRVNLWHGIPLKRFGRLCGYEDGDIAGAIIDNLKQAELGHWNYFYILTTSGELGATNQQAFGVDEGHCVPGPYPRMAYLRGDIKHYLLDEETQCAEKLSRLRASGKRAVCYLPTFRDSSSMNEVTVDAVKQLTDWAKENNAFIITKMHHASTGKIDSDSELLVNIPSQGDVYNFLDGADVLISDYSSVVFDFMFLGRPIVFYCFDRDYYENSDRGFNLDYEKFTPGDKAEDIQALFESLKKAVDSPEEYAESYADRTKQVLDYIGQAGKYEITAKDVGDFWSRIESKKKTEKVKRNS